MDKFTPEKRSELMSNIKTEGTDIEKKLNEIVKKFWGKNRYRKNLSFLPGKPDVVFLKKKVVIFADGDFWHGNNFNSWKSKLPDFWKVKIKENIRRDNKQVKKLKDMGYTVLRFWGSTIKKFPDKVEREISKSL